MDYSILGSIFGPLVLENYQKAAKLLLLFHNKPLIIIVKPSYRWGFPKIRGTLLLGVPIIRTILFWGLYWGPPI